MQVQPYLFFEGRCEEALEFYRSAVGAEVNIMRFRDAPQGEGYQPQPGTEQKVMHAAVRIGETTFMASDGGCSGQPNFQGFALSLTLKDEAQAEPFFKALSQGGEVKMPLTKTFFSPQFGMLADRFGVLWMIYVVPAEMR